MRATADLSCLAIMSPSGNFAVTICHEETSMDDGHELSWNIAPSAEDILIINSAVAKFESAAEPEAEAIFEGLLSDLAIQISNRYTRAQEDAWLFELQKIASATERVEAENISAIVDAILFERTSLSQLRDNRHFGLFKRDYVPEESIYNDVDTDGATVVATATKYRVYTKGYPIFEGAIEVLKDDGSTLDSFEFATGSGSRSHTITNGPLPPGRYSVHSFRLRSELGFVVDGIGYSLNLDELDATNVYGRKYFRIHPDGWPPGTKGCIGVRGGKSRQRRAMELFQSLLTAPGADGRAVLAMRYLR